MSAVDIALNLRASTEDVKKQTETLRREIEAIFSQTAGSTEKSIVSMKEKMAKLYTETFKVDEELEKIANKEVPSNEYAQLERELQASEKAANSTEKALNRLLNTQKYRKLSNEIEETKNKLVDAQIQLEKVNADDNSTLAQQMKAEGAVRAYQIELAQLEKDFAKMRDLMRIPQLEEDLRKAREESDKINANMAEMRENGTAFVSGKETEEYKNKLAESAALNNKLKVLIASATGADSAFAKLGRTIGAVAKESLSVFGSATKGGFTKLKNAISKVHSETKKARKTMLMFVKAMLGVRGLFMLFRKLRTAISEGFKYLSQFDGQTIKFKSDIEGLKKTMMYLKNSIAVSFAPLVTAVIPYLKSAANALAEFMTQIGAFFALLTGQSVMLVAKKDTQEYDKALKSAAGSAKKLNNELYSFDTLNKQQDKSGGANGQNMFEEVAPEGLVSEKLKKLVDSLREFWSTLKELWAKKDWFGIGKLIAKFFTDLLPDDWSKIYDGVRELANGIGEFINGIFSDPTQFEKIGKAIAGAINTIIVAFSTLMKKLDWENIGESFGEGVNGIVGEVDTGELAQGISAMVNGIWKAIKKAAKTIEWKDVFSTLFDFFSDLDIGTIGIIAGAITLKAIGNILIASGVLSKVALAIVSGLGNVLATGAQYAGILALNLVKMLGTALIQFGGLIKTSAGMLGTAFVNVGSAIIGSIGSSITAAGGIGGLLFGDVATLSAAGVGAGTLIGAGLIGSISAAIGGFGFGTLIGRAISKDEDVRKMKGHEIAADLIRGFKEGDLWPALAEWWIDFWDEGLFAWFKDIGKKAKEWATNIWKGFVEWEGWTTLAQWWGDFWDLVISKIKKIFGIASPSTVFEDIGGNLIKGLVNGITEIWNSLKDKVTAPFEWLKAKVADIFDINSPSKVFENYGRFIDLGFAEGIEGDKSVVARAMDDMVSGMEASASFAPNFGRIANFSNIPIPALATGGVVPPNAYGGYGTGGSDNGLISKIQELIDRLDGGGSPVEVHAHLELDGKEIYDSVVTQNNNQIQRTGSSRIKV